MLFRVSSFDVAGFGFKVPEANSHSPTDEPTLKKDDVENLNHAVKCTRWSSR